MRADLSGQVVTRAAVQIPAWGMWWAEVETSASEVLEDNTVKLTINDLALDGTYLTAGTYSPTGGRGRARYRIVGGSGGWGELIPAQSYTSDFQVRRTDVLRDAATAAGELIDLAGVAEDSLGNHWVRQAGTAASTLELVQPQAWYVDVDGWTRFGARPAMEYTGDATRMDGTDRAAGKIELAPISLQGLLPGAVIDGMTAVDVEHQIAREELRTTVWGQRGASSRLVSALDRVVRALMADWRLRGLWDYRVVSQEGERLTLQPVRASTGLPFITRARVRLAPGYKAEHRPGSLVLVAFVDGSPSRPVVVSGDDPDSPGWLPEELAIDSDGLVKLGDGLLRVLTEGRKMSLLGVQGNPSGTAVDVVATITEPVIPSPKAWT